MLKIAAIQMSMCEETESNITKAELMVREAALNGAQIILLPELFSTLYFCKDRDECHFNLAKEFDENVLIAKFAQLAKELEIVLPISYFEKSGDEYFNSLAVIDANGEVVANYRKSHIPDGDGYEEKFYFKRSDGCCTVVQTAYASLGVGICWDQWFPEYARTLVIKGAQILLFPTAIGSEPGRDLDSKEHWQRVQQGHSAANIVPLVAANRVGIERGKSCSIKFYGSSFICDERGKILQEASRQIEEIVYASFELEKVAELREYWGILRDRRTDLY